MYVCVCVGMRAGALGACVRQRVQVCACARVHAFGRVFVHMRVGAYICARVRAYGARVRV